MPGNANDGRSSAYRRQPFLLLRISFESFLKTRVDPGRFVFVHSMEPLLEWNHGFRKRHARKVRAWELVLAGRIVKTISSSAAEGATREFKVASIA